MSARPTVLNSVDQMTNLPAQNQAILEQAMLVRDMFDDSPHGMFRTTRTGQYLNANKALANLYGYESPKALYQALTSINFQLYVDPGRRAEFIRLVAEHGHVTDFEAQIYRADGSAIWICEVAREVRNKNGEFLYYEGTVIDITVRKEAEQALMRSVNRERLQKGHFETALDNMSQGLCLFGPDGGLIVANRRFVEMYRLPPDRLVPGMSLPAIRAMIRSITGDPPAKRSDLCPHGTALSDVELTALIARRQSAAFTQELANGTIITIAHEPTLDGGFVDTFTDVTEQRLAEARLTYAATHDALTGLPNRTRFHEQLNEALQQAGPGKLCAVLYLDLDQFKMVNDTLGHPVGDGLLKFVADHLQKLTRKGDTVARLGGDEFAIILPGIKDVNDTTHLVDRLLVDLTGPHHIDKHRILSSVSIGIALAPNDGLDADHLLKCADIALYRAKALGRNRACYFELGMDALMRERRDLEQELSVAAAQGEFELHYQPQVDLNRDVIVGFEALLRWRSPRRGLVEPADFIALAEETGLIVSIGAWVLETACREATTWPDNIRVAVNISARQFVNHDLVGTVCTALDGSGLPANRLELEITETVMISDDTRVVATLHALKKLGVTVAMDDFGVGYSSLSYLRRFPFDRIKIDRSFVKGIGHGSDDIAIIRAVISLCGSLGVAATVEGVETADQLALLRAERCHEVQGYLISRPQSAVDTARLIGKSPIRP
jgi:diguanylate cyclase (GGDEF)-like protein/PAS domain S-box-containing protein